MNKRLILALSLSFLISLNGYTQSAVTKNKIEFIDYKKEIPVQNFIETFVKEVEVIPLETTKLSLIDKYPRLEIFDNQFYVYNILGIYKILRFDSNGKFLNSVGASGRGPQEFNDIANIEVDKKGVSLLSARPSYSIYRFNHNGKFISKRLLDEKPLQLFSYKEGSLIFNGFNNAQGRLIFTDSLGKNARVLLKEKKFFQNMEGVKAITSSCKDFLSFNDCFTDTIYRISGLSASPSVVYNMKEYKTAKELLEQMKDQKSGFINAMNSLFSVVFYFYENHKYILSAHTVFNKGESFLLCMIKDKVANRWEWIRYSEIEANKALLLSAILTEKSEIITIVQPETVINLPDSIMKLLINKELVKSLKEEDNYVILRMKLK
jgi:hypothetical protein